jgi:flagellar secretion chaperone FliS
MAGSYQHNAYKAAAWREPSKTLQVVMLYEGVIRFVQQARAAIEANDIEARYNSITKACDIITGLQLSLNHDAGGELAKTLYDYYAGLDAQLLSLHFTPDLNVCDSCLRCLHLMKDAWEDVHKETEDKAQDAPNNAVTGLEYLTKKINSALPTADYGMSSVDAAALPPLGDTQAQGLNVSA